MFFSQTQGKFIKSTTNIRKTNIFSCYAIIESKVPIQALDFEMYRVYSPSGCWWCLSSGEIVLWEHRWASWWWFDSSDGGLILCQVCIVVMDKIPKGSPTWFSIFLEKDRLSLTNREILCRKVLFNLSIGLVWPVSFPTGRWRLLGITVLYDSQKSV
jgi:hypothetical protein